MTGIQHDAPAEADAVVAGPGDGVLVGWHRFRSGSGSGLVVADVSAAGLSGPGQDQDVPWTIAAAAGLAAECGTRFGVAYGTEPVLRMLRAAGLGAGLDLRASVGHFAEGLTEGKAPGEAEPAPLPPQPGAVRPRRQSRFTPEGKGT